MKKCYVVWKGRQEGIFFNWEECKASTNGFPGAKFKAYQSIEQAKAAFAFTPEVNGTPTESFSKSYYDQCLLIGEPAANSFAAIGIWDPLKDQMFTRLIFVHSGAIMIQEGPFLGGSQLLAEFIAIALGVKYLENKQLKPIVYCCNIEVMEFIQERNYLGLLSNIPQDSESLSIFRNSCKIFDSILINERLLRWEDLWGNIPGVF